PPSWGYGICALVVIPLVTHGVTAISRLQVWTQPLWLALLVLPLAWLLWLGPPELAGIAARAGTQSGTAGFSAVGFGAALTVGMALITQMGEQADYLRFMPEQPPPAPAAAGPRWAFWRRPQRARLAWWGAVLMGGPGWVLPGVAKMLAGVLLAGLALAHSLPAERAVDPNQMYLAAWEYVFPDYGWAVAATALFVVVSQLKINVTNAYAGSLAWSNFFSRITHSHPGRVVWVVFNTLIALVLMEMDVFQALGHVLGLYSNIAIAWIMAVVADLVISKPLGLSPPGIEFRRAHLVDINPVGVGAMGVASVLSVAAHLGAFGPLAQAWSAMIAAGVAMLVAPLLAWATGGRFYLAPRTRAARELQLRLLGTPQGRPASAVTLAAADAHDGAPLAGRLLRRCAVCEGEFEPEDMAACPAYGGLICSLCCTLDARCGDLCKPQARLSAQWQRLLQRLLPPSMAQQLDSGLAHYLMLLALVVPALAGLFWALYALALRSLRAGAAADVAVVAPLLRNGLLQAFFVLLLAAGMLLWWLVLAQRSRELAQAETRRQTQALHAQTLRLNRQTEELRHEIASHQRTDAALQQAKAQADAANQAKSRYITTISHELRTPLNSILGYAQLLEDDPAIPPHRREAIHVIRRGGDHLLSLIEGTLDIARIESGRLALESAPLDLPAIVDELAHMFSPQAAARGLGFEHRVIGTLPARVRADEKRLRQILINLLGNAVKFTRAGQVRFRVEHAREMARFEIEDSGPGMGADELQRVFEPFERGRSAGGNATTGTGLGLTIARMLTELMGGELTVRSTPGVGSCFTVRLYLPALTARARPRAAAGLARITGHAGPARRLLVVDNEEADRRLLADRLAPLGFVIEQAGSGEAALARLADAARPPFDAVFLDLAMPGIDGWTTLRQLRARHLTDAPVAIVSANAFDKGLDNDLGISPADFLVKPVRMDELLGWLQRRLAVDWRREAPAAVPASAVASPAGPTDGPPDGHPEVRSAALDAAALLTLDEPVRLGYLRGILRQLDALEAAHPAEAALLQRWRALARGFQLDTLAEQIAREGEARAAAPTPPAGPAPADGPAEDAAEAPAQPAQSAAPTAHRPSAP
ncbi:MAG: hypothetical protein RL223_4593, partial [Pseudomonadota bacterium]